MIDLNDKEDGTEDDNIETSKKNEIYIYGKELAIFYANRAAVSTMKQEYQKCIDDCDKAITYNDKYLKAYSRRAKAYNKLDKIN